MAKNWKNHPLEDGNPPAWTSGWGQDRYGVWVEFSIRKVTQRMRWIMPGTFTMGSPDSDKEALHSEKPAHLVTISRGFWLFDTPCRRDLWEAVLGAEANRSRFSRLRRPVENVSWDDTAEFHKRLSELRPGLLLRLPSEAEWEYACRAGTRGPRYGELDDIAWYWENSGSETHDVGLKKSNAWGCYDMLGNVWEWCLDQKRDYTPLAITDPLGTTLGGVDRVIRGGGSSNGSRLVRAAERDTAGTSEGGIELGFRSLCSG
jgi:formylglycine-generating enzyme